MIVEGFKKILFIPIIGFLRNIMRSGREEKAKRQESEEIESFVSGAIS